MEKLAPDESQEAAVAARLKESIPAPRPELVAELERRVIPPAPPEEGSTRSRPVRATGTASAALAALFLAWSLLGQGPLRPQEASSTRGAEDCRVVPVTKRVEVPMPVDRGGEVRLRYRELLVERRIERCP